MIINGNNLPNVLIGSNDPSDTINGFAGNDVLIGLAGNDFLIGGIGADVMAGGAGNDTYFVDNVGDSVAEAVNEGIDRVVSSISFSLSAAGRFDVENLTLSGAAAINGFGNALNNVIVGNNANNILSGLAGNDTMFGLGGNDSMFGGIGNDVMLGGIGNDLLDGGIGADNMRGEAGNDTYVVDNVGDVVTELAGAGIDTIRSSISLSLNVAGRVNVENLTLTGVNPISGFGNALNNVIVGNNANNTLSGLDGNDSLFGLGGSDSMFGGTGNDSMSGGIGNDLLNGGAGNDVHIGGLGADTVVTGVGFDTILFNTALGAGNVDSIADFAPVFDTIRLENAEFTALAAGALPAAAFRIGAVALDGSDRIIYNAANGALNYDPDGLGGIAQVQFATLSAGLAMTAADFLVV